MSKMNELKNERINVRANGSMKSDLKFLRVYLERRFNKKFSDSEVLDLILKFSVLNGGQFLLYCKDLLDS